MKIIREVICSKCGKKQVRDKEELLKDNLFWRVCEFCNQYGLEIVTRHELSVREWLEALFNTWGVRVAQTEAFLKDLLKDRSRH